ncbi:MAG: hypothetical protein KKB30_10160 [Proteobacteria bacterium]|nr:hypothetical protein [Pseudomonadota bacterium]MBU1716413.1 hypothetical protein [Pseudomonadota bacterium]
MVKYNRIIQQITVVLFFILIFLYFVIDLIDPDLPWHLATGKYILATKTIPTSDPFTYSTDNNFLPFTSKFVLTQYWLGQAFLAFVYSKFGVPGLITLRAVLFTIIIFIVQKTLKGKHFILSLAFSIFYTAYLLHGQYYTLRPVLISFLFSAIILYQFLQFTKQSNIKYIIPIPLLMIIWANMHGGYIFGLLIITIHLVAYIINNYLPYWNDSLDRSLLKQLSIISLLSFVMASFNPNGLDAIGFAFASHYTDVYKNVIELQSPFHSFQIFSPGVIKFWCILPLNLLIIIYSIQKKQLLPLLLVAASTFMAFTAVRFIPLMVITVSIAISHLQFKLPEISKRFHYPVSLTVLFIVMIGILWLYPGKKINTFRFKNNLSYPVSAAEFMRRNLISGNIFSTYNKSSYLMFSLYPESNIYVDSRHLYPDRIEMLNKISGGESIYQTERNNFVKLVLGKSSQLYNLNSNDINNTQQDPLVLLNSINAEIVIHEAMQILNGNLYILPLKLYLSGNWILVYADGYVMIFLKDIPKFKHIINLYRKDKDILFDELIAEGKMGLRYGMHSNFYSNIAFGFMGKGLYGEKVKILLEKSLELSTKNQTANTLLTILQNGSLKEMPAK